jgi:transcriptional regulator with XRE-family HTH domain
MGGLLMHFGELLRRLRGTRSQKDVAGDLGMPVTTLSTLENQETIPRGPVLKKLADHFGVPLTYFYSPPTTEMRSTDAARDWLLSLKRPSSQKNTIATHAPPEYPDDVKRQFAEKIKQKKRAETADSK